MVYLYPIFLSTIVFVVASSGSKREQHLRIILNKLALLFGASCFVLFVSLRWETGTDWEPYYNYFKSLVNSRFYVKGGFELFFCGLTYIIAQVTENYTVYLLIISSSAFLLFLSIDSLVPKEGSRLIAFLATYVTFLQLYMGGLRQSLAVAFSVSGLAMMNKNKKLTGFLFLLVACFFHTSALISVFYPFLYGKKLSKSKVSILLLLSVFPLLLYFILPVMPGFDHFMIKKMVVYVGYGGVLEEIDYQRRDPVLIAERLLFLLVFYILGRGNYSTFSNRRKFFLAYVFSTVFYISAMFTFRNLAGRGIFYFRPFDIVLMSLIPYDFSIRLTRCSSKGVFRLLARIAFYIYLVLRFVVVVLLANGIYYLPYKSIL